MGSIKSGYLTHKSFCFLFNFVYVLHNAAIFFEPVEISLFQPLEEMKVIKTSEKAGIFTCC